MWAAGEVSNRIALHSYSLLLVRSLSGRRRWNFFLSLSSTPGIRFIHRDDLQWVREEKAIGLGICCMDLVGKDIYVTVLVKKDQR